MIEVKILAPEEVVYTGLALSISVPSQLHNFSILKGHAPLVSTLYAGIITVLNENNEKFIIVIEGGFIEINKDIVTISIEEFIFPSDINIATEDESLKSILASITKSEYEVDEKLRKADFSRIKISLEKSLLAGKNL